MSNDFDVLIVGSGPAGVSAAFPLVMSGLKVLMVDGGSRPNQPPPIDDFITWRTNDPHQHETMIGENFYALKAAKGSSPKLRVPSLEYVFSKFQEINQITENGFTVLGSMASGGLSNAWGCGVATLSNQELLEFPFPSSEIRSSYADVASRIGISGGEGGDLSEYYGTDAWSQPCLKMDAIHESIFRKYEHSREKHMNLGFTLDRPRMAVLNQGIDGSRSGCSYCGNCLWGCSRKSLYSSVDDLPRLMKFENFKLHQGFEVHDLLNQKDGSWITRGYCNQTKKLSQFSSLKLFMAAGTISTTRLVLKSLNYQNSVQMFSCPTAAFMLWSPNFVGHSPEPSFGSGQLAFKISLDKGVNAYGATFSTMGIPVSELAPYLPFSSRYGIDFLRHFLSSCIIGNLFLPGEYGIATAKLEAGGGLTLKGSDHKLKYLFLSRAEKILRARYLKMGALLIPRSFKSGKQGADVHYAGTFPMKQEPKINQTNSMGELRALPGMYIVDGASLSALSEKPHTFTIMANADRIGKRVAQLFN